MPRRQEEPAIKLSHLAAINTAALVAQQLVVMVVSFLITPLLVAAVGVAVFGIWQLIVKWSAYLVFLDGRAHENLKWLISRSADETDDYKRQALTASLRVWLTYLPLLLLGAGLFVYFIAEAGREEDVSTAVVMTAAVLMAINALLLGLQRFPEGLLVGTNQAYRSAFGRVLILLVSGVGSYLAVYYGHGLVGLATVQACTTALLGIMFMMLARRHIGWLGLARPPAALLRRLYATGFWFFLWSIVNFALLQMELLMLGVFGSAELVGKFAITFFAVQAVTVMIETVTTAVLPGIGTLLGKGEMEKVRQVRMEGNLYSWWLGLSLSVAVIVVNQSFVGVWVGEDAFAGSLESFLIVVLALQLVVLKNDSLLINLALEQKRKVQVTALSIGAVFLLSALLVPEYGIVGVCLAGIAGRAMLMVFYPRIINRFLQQSASPVGEIRRWVVSAAFLVGSVIVAEHVTVQGWFALVAVGAVTFLAAFALYYLAGMSAAQRQLASARVQGLLSRMEKH